MGTSKKIEPKNPDTTVQSTDTSRDTERKNQSFKIKGRKMGRKTSAFKGKI